MEPVRPEPALALRWCGREAWHDFRCRGRLHLNPELTLCVNPEPRKLNLASDPKL